MPPRPDRTGGKGREGVRWRKSPNHLLVLLLRPPPPPPAFLRSDR
uniref:DRH1 n=1 Tax=Arundo donax TaxID=35708 RepID=A0A0A9D4V2_ARUDO